MLIPAQVIPFLSHDDEKVRKQAALYLIDAHDPAPATTDDVWRAIDRLGRLEYPLSAGLARLPQTQESYLRLVATLRQLPASGAADGEGGDPFWYALARLQWDLLVEHRDEVLDLARARPPIYDHLAGRLDLRGVPSDELWGRLLTRAEQADERSDKAEKDRERFDPLVHLRLIEALARDFPGEAGARAADLLRGGTHDSWMDIYCVELVGRAKYRQAVPLLLDRMLSDADLLMETVNGALVALGDADVVRQIEAFYPGKPVPIQLYLDEPLGKIKLPESEAALLRMIRGETNPDVLTSICSELLDLCASPEGLEVVREVVVGGRYDHWMDHLDERLLTVGTMVGYEPPEAPQWREVVAERDAARAKRTAMFDEMFKQPGGATKAFAAALTELAGMSGKSGRRAAAPPRPAPRPAALPDRPDTLTPVRRGSAKVGRNDPCPCPCGSGKKFKKCCMKSDAEG